MPVVQLIKFFANRKHFVFGLVSERGKLNSLLWKDYFLTQFNKTCRVLWTLNDVNIVVRSYSAMALILDLISPTYSFTRALPTYSSLLSFALESWSGLVPETNTDDFTRCPSISLRRFWQSQTVPLKYHFLTKWTN